MPDLWFAVPGDIATPTGGYVYARRLLQALPATGWPVRLLGLPGGHLPPTAEAIEAAYRVFEALPRGSLVLVDGLAFGTLTRARLAGIGHRWVALVHHPLALETGLDAETAARLRATEADALTAGRAVIATSAHTADVLSRDFGVPRQHLHVATPGTDPAERAHGGGATPRLLSVGTVTARKGHDVLVEALGHLRDVPWHCRIVGSLKRDPATVARVAGLIRTLGLGEQIALEGEMAAGALDAAYRSADLFVLPSRYEGYGMVFAEALARGLPIVACAAGAVSQTVPSAAGLLVGPDDVEGLAAALRRLLLDVGLRREMAEAAWVHGRTLPTWADTARRVGAALTAASA